MNLILKISRASALLLAGLSAGVACSHFLEMPNKIALSKPDYLLVQQRIYEGFGKVVGPIEAGALISAISIALFARKKHQQFWLTLIAIGCFSLALIVWQLHNGPVNEAVDSWTTINMPADWENYRDRWEYAHATRAILYTLGFCLLIVATLNSELHSDSDITKK